MFPTWLEFMQAFSLFTGAGIPKKSDYAIVGHPELAKKGLFPTVFEPPNPPSNHGRVYTVTSLKGLDEKTFLEKYGQGKEVVIIEGCMDKDASLPLYEEIQKKHPEAQILALFYAGGAVQTAGKRSQARETIHQYLAFHARVNVKTAYLTGHNNRCGFVAHATGEALRTSGYKSGAERRKMKGLILSGTKRVSHFYSEKGIEVKPVLVIIDRENPLTGYKGGAVELDCDFEGITPEKLENLRIA